MNTRRLDILDLDKLLALMEVHIKELQAYLPYEPSTLRHYVSHSIAQAELWLYFGAFDDQGQLVGYAFGTKEPYFFNSLHYFICHSLYVHPEWRGRMGGKSIIRGMERESLSKGCHEIFLSVTHGHDHKKVLRFFGALGYTDVGGSYRKNLVN